MTDENALTHHDHWIEATARQYVRAGRPINTVGTAFHPAMKRLLEQGVVAQASAAPVQGVPLEQRTTAQLLARTEQLRKLLDVEPQAGELFSTINERLYCITAELAKVYAELTRRAGVQLQLLETDLS